MFAEETEKLVNELIQAEYKNACETARKEFNDEYTDKYHSLYEGYAVLLEEVEEVNNEFCAFKSELDHFWYWIKKNDTESTCFGLEVIENRVISSMKELAQVGAVLMKIKNTFGKDINVVTNEEVEE